MKKVLPFSYVGSKMRMVGKIISLMPHHKIYVEPYCGSAVVGLYKSLVRRNVLNDLDGEIVNFFKVLQSERKRDQLYSMLEFTPYSRDIYVEQFGLDPRDLMSVERAYRFYVLKCMSFGGRSGRSDFRPERRNVNMSVELEWRNRISYLHYIADKLRFYLIENSPALSMLDLWDSPVSLFYLDPPYYQKDYYKYGLNREDHIVLLKKIQSMRGMIILSGYDSRLYNRYLSDWSKIVVSSYANTYTDDSIRRFEVIWLNPNLVKKRELHLV